MATARYGSFQAERETLALARQLRAGGLTLAAIADRLADMGYTNRNGNRHGEMAVSRILRRGQPPQGVSE